MQFYKQIKQTKLLANLGNIINIAKLSKTSKTQNLASKLNQESVWPIAWVSFFWSTASLMVLAILPVFLTEELHLNYKGIGLLEGVAIAAAFSAKVITGIASDYWRRRKLLIIIGSLMTAITKPMFALATSWVLMFVSRFVDRLGKGIRSAPADALVANISCKDTVNYNFGIRQALYALGTVCGSTIAMIVTMQHGTNYRLIFFAATIPALAALTLLFFTVTEPKVIVHNSNWQWKFTDIFQLQKLYWFILLMTTVLMMARFSEVFMLLQAKQVGWSISLLPIVIITVDLFHAGSAFANKKLVDKLGDTNLLIMGFLLLIGADILFAFSNNWPLIIVGIIFNGLHLGLTQGILRAMIAKICLQHLVGTAFSLFYLVSGFGVLCGNYLAGSLADTYGLSAAFIGGMCATIVAMAIFICCHYRVKATSPVTI